MSWILELEQEINIKTEYINMKIKDSVNKWIHENFIGRIKDNNFCQI